MDKNTDDNTTSRKSRRNDCSDYSEANIKDRNLLDAFKKIKKIKKLDDAKIITITGRTTNT